MVDVLFINATKELMLKKEVNGTLLLATKLLQAGFQVDILRYGQIEGAYTDYPKFINGIVERILQIATRCLSIYTLYPDFHIMLRIAREVKTRKPEVNIVFAGPQTSGVGGILLEAMDFVDYVCTGEGEETVVPFFTAILNKNGEGLDAIPALHYRKSGCVVSNDTPVPICDLNTLPYWDDRLLLPESFQNVSGDYYFMPLDAGRGCPYNCSYCCTSYFWRRTYRLKSPERIVADIRYFYDKYGIRSFIFCHDAFTSNKKLVGQVCDAIIESGLKIRWKCSARIDCLTEELILKMKQAGMTQIEMGIETGSARMQKLIHKNLNLDRAKQMIEFLLKNNIYVTVFFMYGLPEETEADLNETLEMLFTLKDQGVHMVTLFFCQFTPTTEITERFLDDLVFDPKIKIVFRNAFGFREELPVILENKALFPFYYHLDTPVRNNYQYLRLLKEAYERLPRTVMHLRKLYKGDHLKFYRDFVDNNAAVFDMDIDDIEEYVQKHSLEMILNTPRNLDVPYLQQLNALITYTYDLRRVYHMDEGAVVTATYDFNYVDIKLNRPVEEYSKGRTKMLLKKENGKVEIQVLDIQWA